MYLSGLSVAVFETEKSRLWYSLDPRGTAYLTYDSDPDVPRQAFWLLENEILAQLTNLKLEQGGSSANVWPLILNWGHLYQSSLFVSMTCCGYDLHVTTIIMTKSTTWKPPSLFQIERYSRLLLTVSNSNHTSSFQHLHSSFSFVVHFLKEMS